MLVSRVYILVRRERTNERTGGEKKKKTRKFLYTGNPVALMQINRMRPKVRGTPANTNVAVFISMKANVCRLPAGPFKFLPCLLFPSVARVRANLLSQVTQETLVIQLSRFFISAQPIYRGPLETSPSREIFLSVTKSNC